jgi:hypothetical protein
MFYTIFAGHHLLENRSLLFIFVTKIAHSGYNSKGFSAKYCHFFKNKWQAFPVCEIRQLT